MSTLYNITTPRQSDNNGFGLQTAVLKYDCTLTSGGGEKTLTIPDKNAEGISTTSPTNNYVAIYKVESGKNVWVANGATATATAGASFAATDSELIVSGDGRYVRGGDVLHFITADATATINVLLYWVP
jgi:hypothetical protein